MSTWILINGFKLGLIDWIPGYVCTFTLQKIWEQEKFWHLEKVSSGKDRQGWHGGGIRRTGQSWSMSWEWRMWCSWVSILWARDLNVTYEPQPCFHSAADWSLCLFSRDLVVIGPKILLKIEITTNTSSSSPIFLSRIAPHPVSHSNETFSLCKVLSFCLTWTTTTLLLVSEWTLSDI